MYFTARSIRDENYKNEMEKDEEIERGKETKEEKRKRDCGLDAEGLVFASRRINREPAEILPVLDPLIVGPEGADQEVRCLRNSQIVLHVYVDGFSDFSHII